MNKYIKFTLCGSFLALFACQSNEVTDITAPDDGTQKISLRIADARSRAGRPLLSSEASQTVENVMIVLTDDKDAVVWTRQISDWNSSDESIIVSSHDYGYGRESEIEIPKDECRLLGGVKYHAYALGYSNGSDYDLTQFTSLKVGDTYKGDAKIAIKGKVMGEEIFAGDNEIIGKVSGIRTEVVLNRQVAGTYGYFTAVPYVRDYMGHVGSYLILTMDNPQSAFALGAFDNFNANSEYKGNYVVNGCQKSETSVVYSINLSDWFVSIQPERDAEGRPTGLILGGDNWKGNPRCYRVGSVFGGSFILPTTKTDNPTLKLHLCYDNDVNTSMRTWSITLPSSAPQLSEYTLCQYTADGWTTATMTDTPAKYNVLRNHLYAIGIKEYAVLPSNPGSGGDPNDPNNPGGGDPNDPNNPGGGDPSDPNNPGGGDPSDPNNPGGDPSNPGNPGGGDPNDPNNPGGGSNDDVPEPINNKQELTVTVNHNWQYIYIMEVE